MTNWLAKLALHTKSRGISLDDSLVAILQKSPRAKVIDDINSIDWQLLGIDEEGLFSKVEMSGISAWAIDLPVLFSATLLNCGIDRLNGGEFHVDKLREMIAIGSYNGDYLLLDGTGKIWTFFHDGHQIELLSQSWRELVEGKKLQQIDESLLQIDERLLGTWMPFESTWRSLEFRPILMFAADGFITKRFANDEVVTNKFWCEGKNRLFIDNSGVILDYQYSLHEEELDLRESAISSYRLRKSDHNGAR